MPRRYRRRRYAIARPLKTAKYSNETYGTNIYGLTLLNSSIQKQVPMVPNTTVLATRKCKNFTLRIGIVESRYNTTRVNDGFLLHWALVFVPQGLSPSNLVLSEANAAEAQPTSISVYEPNQNVIMQGVITDMQAYTYKTRLARNLNSGDSIYLVTCFYSSRTGEATETADFLAAATLNYAVSY